MLTIERGAAPSTPVAASGVPRIAPVHDPLDKRHSDLSFTIDTGGRPRFRVLVARDKALFAIDQAGARNGSNFFDSQHDGLLPYDGPPCFYLVPRSALHAMLPAPRLYYTLIAYDDTDGTKAVYAHPPETLATGAPSVAVAPELTGTLGMMFGTPVARLLRVGAATAWEQAAEETGEDLGGSVPEEVGLAADDGEPRAPSGDEVAAAYEDGPAGDEVEQACASSDDDTDDSVDSASAYAADDELRTPVDEAAAFDDEAGEDLQPVSAAYDDGYDDGYGATAQAADEVHAYEEQAEDHPADEVRAHGEAQAYGGAQAYGDDAASYEALREPVPEMLPDEDADGSRASQAGEHDDDEVEIESPVRGQAYGDGDGENDYADGYGGAEAYAAEPARAPFDIEACKAILARIMPFESGSEGFARVQDDGEFSGRFGTTHPAYRKYHLGLTFGGFPFVQEHGTLGQLLGLMRERDRATFDATFPEADTLIAVTNAADGPRAWQSPDGTSQRLRPVAGQRLWLEPWLARFRKAGRHPAFQAAQNEMAARLYVQPVLPVCQQIGLDSEQGLAMAIDRAVQMGADSALAWILECATPVETPAMKQAALNRLGHADLASFQAAQKLPVTGVWNVAAHAALIAALRTSGKSSSPLLGCNEIVAAMLRHAQGTPWAARLQRIRDSSAAERLFQL